MVVVVEVGGSDPAGGAELDEVAPSGTVVESLGHVEREVEAVKVGA